MFSFRRCYQDVVLSVPSILDVQYWDTLISGTHAIHT